LLVNWYQPFVVTRFIGSGCSNRMNAVTTNKLLGRGSEVIPIRVRTA
jgi:hypothetical protein